MKNNNYKIILTGLIGISFSIIAGCGLNTTNTNNDNNELIEQNQRPPRNGQGNLQFGSGENNMGGRRKPQGGMMGSGVNLSGDRMRGERPMNGEMMSGIDLKGIPNE